MPGLYTHITRASGTILTAGIYNSDHQNHIDNHIPAMIDDYSVNLAQMQSQVDPGEFGTENLATSLAGEIERFRFALKELKGTTYWYETAVNLALLGSAQTFTQKQTIEVASGTALELRGLSASSPNLILNSRKAGAGADGDELGQIEFWGKSSTTADRTMAFIDSILTVGADATRTAVLRLITVTGGAAAAEVVRVGTGMRLASPAGGDKGLGTLNAAAGVYINGHGTVAQHIPAFNSTYQTLGAIFPADDTIPQITEGDEVLSVTITPTDANSRILVRGVLNVGGPSSAIIGAASFRVGFTDGIGACETSINVSTTMQQLIIESSYNAVDTSTRTYTIRCGSASATDVKLNGVNLAREFGGSAVSRMDVFEVLPQ